MHSILLIDTLLAAFTVMLISMWLLYQRSTLPGSDDTEDL
jgi:hypothetical protein